jgi:acetylornithine deacetylase
MLTQPLESLRDPIRAWLDGRRDDIADLLLDLVGAQSITLDEAPAQAVVQRFVTDRGWEIDRFEATREEIANYIVHVGEQDRYENRPNLVAKVPGTGGGKSLMLQGHVDVVDPGDPALWQHDPWGERDGDCIYGRGSVDMKGGVVSMLLARQVLAELGIGVKGDVYLATTVGEEDGGLGALAVVLRGYRPDGVVIPEPTGRTLVIAQGGSLVFRITVHGKAAHGANRNAGESAVEHFYPIFHALLEWERERNDTLSHPLFDVFENKFPISVGVVRAGDWASTVPESLVAEGRLGFLPGETIEGMMRQAEELIARVASEHPWLRDHPPTVEWFGGQFAASEIPADHPLTQTVARAHQLVTGEPVEIAAITGGTDARLFTDIAGIPAVVYGAGQNLLAHMTDEYIELEEVLGTAETLALSILDWCGYDAPAST